MTWDIEYISTILPILKAHNVESFKIDGLEIVLHRTMTIEIPTPIEPISEPSVVEVPDPPNMPPELKFDQANDYDKLLNWSASPDPNDKVEVPLTGEVPVE